MSHPDLHTLPQPKPHTPVSTQHTELCSHFTPAGLGKTPSYCVPSQSQETGGRCHFPLLTSELPESLGHVGKEDMM